MQDNSQFRQPRRNPRKPAPNFTLKSAHAALPLVRSIVRDILELSSNVVQTKSRLDYVNEHRAPGFDIYREEVEAVGRVLLYDEKRLVRCLTELSELGVEFHGVDEAIVSFPASYEGNDIYLCWKYDEPMIRHWCPAALVQDPLDSEAKERPRPIETLIQGGSDPTAELN